MTATRKYQALIVEDNSVLCGLMELALQHIGIETTGVSTGHAALDYLEHQTPDLMILDLALPEMSGWDVLDTARERKPEVYFPVIVLTALKDPANRLIGRLNKPPVFRYLAKPFQISALHTAVREALQISE